ncbi:MAG: hypothetical protein K6G83_08275 [Lachnospiraceae bacterium]|nr:hypothetical protein [Lachnospiraceae bacterium]
MDGLKKEGTGTSDQKSIIIKYLTAAAVLALLIFLLELFLFNFRHWQSVNNVPFTPEYIPSDNLTAEDVNAFRVTSSEETPYVEINDLDLALENMAIDITFPEKGVTAVEAVTYHLEVTDEGNVNRYALPAVEFMHLVPQSHFNYLDLYGKAKSVRICFDSMEEGDLFRIEYLNFNSIVPLMISKKRMLALFLFLYLLYILRPDGILHGHKASERTALKYACVAALIVAEAAVVWWGVHANQAFLDPQTDGELQFAHLAEALAEGKPYLLIEPPDALRNMEDPYDFVERMRLCSGEEKALWDTAYYNGHYYVYFGVAPVITYYLPYYLLTGNHIRTVTVVFINALLILIAVPLLLGEGIRRWFKDIPLSVYLMLTAMTSFGTGLLYLIMKADFYSVPLAMALALCYFGLYFWLRSIRDDRIDPLMLGLGSFCMAMEAAVRPQFLLASFLAILLFFTPVFKKRLLFSAKGMRETAAFVLPYLCIAAAVMYYNHIRFGSVFDFGANYNLTNNNMPYRGFRLDRLLNAVAGFLFMPCSFTNRFPYFGLSAFETTYQGPTGDEILLGGTIYIHFYLIITLFPFLFRKIIAKKELYIYTLIAPVAAVIVMIVDANMAGVIMRYNADFSWYLMLSFVIIFCSVTGRLSYSTEAAPSGKTSAPELYDGLLKAVYWLLLILFAFFVIRGFLLMFTGDGNPKLNLKLIWYTVRHLVEFWH